MKKIFSSLIIACFLLVAAVNCFALSDGLYSGEFKIYVDNPTQCAPSNPGYVRITNLGSNEILYQNIVIWGGQEIIIGEKTCDIHGNALLCEPQDQILDMSYWGFDAIVANRANHGAGILVNDTEFVMNYSTRINTCEGIDCDVVAEWMLGEGAEFPCHINPWVSEYTRISD